MPILNWRTMLVRYSQVYNFLSSGWTPLVLASSAGHLEVVKLLLGKGANVDAKTDSSRTALHYAVSMPFFLLSILQFFK